MSKLYFRYAAMAAGKSTALLQVAHNYESLGRVVKLYTAELDHRFGTGKISSRLGIQRAALTFSETTDFILENQASQLDCILIDEAQFLSPAQVKQLHELASQCCVPVICYGLRTDFLGHPFPGSAYLLGLADDIEEFKTICACGKKATMNMRIDGTGQKVVEGPSIEIGGDNRYKAVCATCYYGE